MKKWKFEWYTATVLVVFFSASLWLKHLEDQRKIKNQQHANEIFDDEVNKAIFTNDLSKRNSIQVLAPPSGSTRSPVAVVDGIVIMPGSVNQVRVCQ